MVIYVAVAMLYASLRAAQETPPGSAVLDAALVFGLPLAGLMRDILTPSALTLRLKPPGMVLRRTGPRGD